MNSLNCTSSTWMGDCLFMMVKKGLFTDGTLPFKTKKFVLKLTNPERANHGYNFCFSYKNMFFYVFIFFNNGNEFQPLQSVYGQKIITKQSHPRSNWGEN